mmetsp:Transcript_124369/g.265011  ORF Transcript_124369/g.265011 Transcript_124369/m.265011 type:complete len:306 (-) Transcript_124369:67-984(-)
MVPDEDGDPSKYHKRDLVLQLKAWEKVDVTALAVSTASSILKQRPVLVSFWAFGLLLAAFAGGLPVDEVAQEAYSTMLQHAEVIDSRELRQQALVELDKAEEAYYQARGWFGACDDHCVKARDRAEAARVQAAHVQARRDQALSDARREVGVWSAFGVQDVRASFWDAWKAGKDFAARCTMYNVLFAVGGRDETLVAMIFKLVVQYVVNLTMGLIGAFFFFMYNLYCLIVSYGSSVMSGLAFFLLAAVAGLSLVGTYLTTMYAAVVGGGIMLIQQAAKQAALESDRKGHSRGHLEDRHSIHKDIV